MKKNWKNNILPITILFSLLLLVSCNKGGDHAAHADVYTCPMHPTVVSDKPGTCPVCGMDLVRKARPGEEVEITNELSRLMKSPNEAVVSAIKTIKPEFKSVGVSVDAVGIVTYDTRNIYTIPARVGGRIEKMYLKYEFEVVRKGQKIAEIYSPELITAQRELLYLLENDRDNQMLLESAKKKLQLLGLSTSQINDLTNRREISSAFSIYSPYDGYVITNDLAPSVSQDMTQPSGAGGQMDGMNASSSGATAAPTVANSNTQPSFLVREGNYVSTGQTLLKVVNTNALRIELDLLGGQMGMVKHGDKLELDLGNGNKVQAAVDFVQPFFNEGQNFLKIRVYTHKINNLHIGQLVRARIDMKSKESLWIPKTALLDLGTDKIVFIKDRDIVKPKRITTGIRTDDQVEVTEGLASSDEIAFNAQYLVDSESFIKPVN